MLRFIFVPVLLIAFTISAIIDHYPVKSIKKIRGVWDKLTFVLAGTSLTLNNIEHDILRKEFRDPRIHFALVCASRGCPKLRHKPFTKINLDDELDYGAAKFINDPEKVLLDEVPTSLTVSLDFDRAALILKENGEFKLNRNPKEFAPVETYLMAQSRFKHLTEENIDVIKNHRDKKWAKMRRDWTR